MRNAFAVLTIFIFIFAPRLDIGIGMNLGLIGALMIVIANYLRSLRMALPLPLAKVTVVFVLLAAYSFVLATAYGNEPAYFLNICAAVVISVTFGWALAGHVETHEIEGSPELVIVLVRMVVLAIFLNSLLIIIEYLFPALKISIEARLIQSELSNINYAEHPFRLRGLASAGGAGLSIVNALAIFLTFFLVREHRMSVAFGIPVSLVLAASNIFTGRTGLIAGIMFLVCLLLYVIGRGLAQGGRTLVHTLAILTGLFVLSRYVLNFELDAEASRWAFEWVDGLASGKLSSSSSDELGGMLYLPTDVSPLIFGAGFFEGESSRFMRSDSGYVKTVLTIGITMGSVMYFSIAYMFARLVKVSIRFRWMVVVILAFMFAVEIKEPFLYQNYAARVIFLLSGAAMYILANRRRFEQVSMVADI